MNGTATIRVAGKGDVPAILEVYAQPTVDAGEVLSNEAAIPLPERFGRYPSYLGFERHGYSFSISLDAA